MLTATLTVSSMQTKAQDATTVADVRCVVIGLQIYDSSDAARQASGIWLSLYYLGRLHGRIPQLDIENLVVQEANKMTPTESASEAKRCGASLSAIAAEVTRIGKDILQGSQKPTS